MISRNRTPSSRIGYGLYLYFLGLPARKAAKALSFLHIVKRSHVAIWKWIQKHRPKRIPSKRKRVSGFAVDETAIKAGSECIWLWVAIEQKDRQILALSISKEGTCLWQRFIAGLVKAHGKHPVSTDGGTRYPQACRFLKLNHRIHSSHEKSIIERTMQYIKDRAECFDDHFPCSRKKGCDFFHIRNWLGLFATMHNKETPNA